VTTCSYWPVPKQCKSSSVIWNDPDNPTGSICLNGCCNTGDCPDDPSKIDPKCDIYCKSDTTLLSTSNPVNITSLTISNNNIIISYVNKTIDTINKWPGSYGSKVMWLYACPPSQGLACLPPKYKNSDLNTYVDDIINSNVNYISLICNLSFKKAADFGVYVPIIDGKVLDSDNTATYPTGYVEAKPASGQHQTKILFTKQQLIKLHNAGISICISINSWMSDFPRDSDNSAKWTDSDFELFVKKFECVRCALGNTIDGLDFDIEGTCDSKCLYSGCGCGWDLTCGGSGGTKTTDGKTCYIFPDQGTINVVNGIIKEMKRKNYICTLVPATNTFFTNEKTVDKDQNHFVKFGLDFNSLDGIMLQMYTGFDAGMCGENYEKCQQKSIEISKINLDELDTNIVTTDTIKNLPSYPNYPNRGPMHCPRYIDCPDWQYDDEKPFERQVEYFTNLVKIDGVTMDKLVFGFEFFYNTSQWGPFPSSSLFYGLNYKLKKATNSELGGIGGWTIAGTFGDYEYPNQGPDTKDGMCECDRSTYKIKKSTNGGLNENMWCIGPYHSHFADKTKGLPSCWGSWGRYSNPPNLIKGTNMCSEAPVNKYCEQEDSTYKIQCIGTGPDDGCKSMSESTYSAGPIRT
jgi:hypothetical protein